MSAPTVSIGLPVYNGERHVAETIESILRQTYTDFELIICDNASIDRTGDICREYAERDARIRYVRNEENLGAAPNYNRVFKLARGTYFKWAPHDDLVKPEFLARCVALFEESGDDVVLCMGERLLMSYEGKIMGGSWEARHRTAIYDRASIGAILRFDPSDAGYFICGLARREAMARTRLIGSYPHSDLVFILELRTIGSFRQIAEPLMITRRPQRTAEYIKERCTDSGASTWFDSKNAGVRIDPERRLMREYRAAIARAPIGAGMKLSLRMRLPLLAVSRRSIHVRRRLYRAWEKMSGGLLLGRRGPMALVRLWMMLAALRRRRFTLVAKAVSLPWTSGNDEVRAFMIDQLARRARPSDPDCPYSARLREYARNGTDSQRSLVRRATAALADKFKDGTLVRSRESAPSGSN